MCNEYFDDIGLLIAGKQERRIGDGSHDFENFVIFPPRLTTRKPGFTGRPGIYTCSGMCSSKTSPNFLPASIFAMWDVRSLVKRFMTR
jgi:hypothetical protein